jgi:hypothetical protein
LENIPIVTYLPRNNVNFLNKLTTHLLQFFEKGMLVVEDKTLGWVMRAFPK